MGKERFKVLCAVYMIIRKGNKILFLRRNNTGYMDGYFSLPAGHLDNGENIAQAVIREAKEELGIIVKEQDLSLIFTGNQHTPDKDYVDLFFEINQYSEHLVNNEPEKCSILDFFELSKIEQNVIPYIAEVLKSIQDKKTFLVFELDS